MKGEGVFKTYNFRLSSKKESDKALYDKLEEISKTGNVSNFIRTALLSYISNGCTPPTASSVGGATNEEIKAITDVLVNLSKSTEEIYDKIKNLSVSPVIVERVETVEKERQTKEADNSSNNANTEIKEEKTKIKEEKTDSKPIEVEEDVNILSVNKDTESGVADDVLSSLADFW